MGDSEKPEWTRYYRIAEGAAALHARFVGHRYPRHAHEHCVIGLVESGIQSYLYRGARHVTPAGDNFDRDVSLSALADLVSLSPYYFARVFEREAGRWQSARLDKSSFASLV